MRKKAFQIQEMRMVQLKQYVVKVGYSEEWLKNQPRVVMMEIMAKAMRETEASREAGTRGERGKTET